MSSRTDTASAVRRRLKGSGGWGTSLTVPAHGTSQTRLSR
jgi:hypothetical protein